MKECENNRAGPGGLFNALATPISVSLTGEWATSTHLLQVVLDYMIPVAQVT